MQSTQKNKNHPKQTHLTTNNTLRRES